MKQLIASIAVCSMLLFSTAAAQEHRTRSGRAATHSPQKHSHASQRRTPAAGRQVTTASHQQPAEIIVDGGEYYEGDYIEPSPIVDGGCSSCGGGCGGACDTVSYDAGCGFCGGGGCDRCSLGPSFCNNCSAPNRFCLCFPSHGWFHAEYLGWYQPGMRTPPMVTTSPDGTPRTDAGVLGEPGTSILFGGDSSTMTDTRNGLRIRFGFWLSSLPCWGVEGEFLGLEETTETFTAQSTGEPILARPFFNIVTGSQDSGIIAYPNFHTGSVNIDITSKFEGAAFRLRRQLCGKSGCCFSQIHCKSVPYSSRLDANIGYRWWGLSESIQIREQTQIIETAQSGSFDIVDRFDTRNLFNGIELGVLWQGRRGCWSADALMRLGVGNVNQTVTITGASRIVNNGVANDYEQGIYALDSNIGSYQRDKFTIVPELGWNLGYQATRRIRTTLGYSLVYWGNVVRPGDQIDTDLNPNLFPPQQPPIVGALRPQFDFVETDYWVHGLSVGAECRW